MGCCLFAIMLAGAPRLAFLLWWIVQPLRMQTTFTTFIWPLIGVIFLPWTTIMYVLVYPAGINGFDYLWLGLALLVDIGTYVGNARAKRDRDQMNRSSATPVQPTAPAQTAAPAPTPVAAPAPAQVEAPAAAAPPVEPAPPADVEPPAE